MNKEATGIIIIRLTNGSWNCWLFSIHKLKALLGEQAREVHLDSSFMI